MLNVLGIKRVVILLGLLAINIALGAAIYLYLTPQLEKQERELRSTRNQASTLQADIDRMRIEFDQFQEQQARFEGYKKDGFFKPQNRRQAEQLFKLIQNKSGVSLATAAVNPAVIEDNPNADKADHKVLMSKIIVRLEALDDVDVSHYLHLIKHYFPGHVTVESVEIRRDVDINGTVLRSISSGQNFPLVRANLELTWRTMIPSSQVIAQEER